MRPLLVPALAGALLLGAAAPAAPPEAPAKFIKVDQLKAQLDRGVKIDVFDVRTPDAYVELHIKGARNLPLRTVEARAPREVSKTGRVVLY
jgi:rhodanese-related sulfurtransferase